MASRGFTVRPRIFRCPPPPREIQGEVQNSLNLSLCQGSHNSRHSPSPEVRYSPLPEQPGVVDLAEAEGEVREEKRPVPPHPFTEAGTQSSTPGVDPRRGRADHCGAPRGWRRSP